jgi:GT2 family glycosyltransferase
VSSAHRAPIIVVLGMMTKIPVGGVVWHTMQFVAGWARLGYDVYYVETHARTPSMFMERPEDDGSARAAAYIADVMHRFDLDGHWAYHALHDDGRCYGMTEAALRKLYRSAALIVNLHGGTEPRPELARTGRLIYHETDPVELEIEVHDNVQETLDFIAPHVAFFTFAENYGKPDCRVPASELLPFKPTRQPVLMDCWTDHGVEPSDRFTSIGNWHQWGRVVLDGEAYTWSKDEEFLKFIDLPGRTGQAFELALSSHTDDDQALLERNGWRVVPALDVSTDHDTYRDYIIASRAEFTVAKDQNVRLRSGWFSERSVLYLAAGRPVVTQDTGFSSILPTGEGLFSFTTMDEAVAGVEAINSDYARHSRAATEVAREYFSYDRVLGDLLTSIGLPARVDRREVFPPGLVLEPVSRCPTTLPEATVRTVLDRAAPALPAPRQALRAPMVSIVVVAYENLVFTRLCLESILLNTDRPSYELVVVDNGSRDGTIEYVRQLARWHRHIRVIANATNRGFAPAANQGIQSSTGRILVLLNNDTVVPPGWLRRLVAHMADTSVGMVGAVTGRDGGHAPTDAPYSTYGEFLSLAGMRGRDRRGQWAPVDMLPMFCVAMRREVSQAVGPLDERFEVGMFEDDDYAARVRSAGYSLRSAEDVFVHHFGRASFDKLVPTGEYTRLHESNRVRFEEKWGVEWTQSLRSDSDDYTLLQQRVRRCIVEAVPPDGVAIVVGKGDERLMVDAAGRRCWHFPADANGGYAGYYPASGEEAVDQLETLRWRGAQYVVIPVTSQWWLRHYEAMDSYLRTGSQVVLHEPETAIIFRLSAKGHG